MNNSQIFVNAVMGYALACKMSGIITQNDMVPEVIVRASLLLTSDLKDYHGKDLSGLAIGFVRWYINPTITKATADPDKPVYVENYAPAWISDGSLRSMGISDLYIEKRQKAFDKVK